MSALCDGTDNCGGGNDETTALCESQQKTENLSLTLFSCFPTDKCRLPYYGGCPYTRECITSEFDVNCGACLSGFIQDPNNNTAFAPCIRKLRPHPLLCVCVVCVYLQLSQKMTHVRKKILAEVEGGVTPAPLGAEVEGGATPAPLGAGAPNLAGPRVTLPLAGPNLAGGRAGQNLPPLRCRLRAEGEIARNTVAPVDPVGGEL